MKFNLKKTMTKIGKQTSKNIGNVVHKGMEMYKEYNKPENIMKRDQARLERLKMEVKIAEQRSKLEKLKARQKPVSLF